MGKLRAAGFDIDALMDVGCTAAELKAAGFALKELKAAGFSAADLRAQQVKSRKFLWTAVWQS